MCEKNNRGACTSVNIRRLFEGRKNPSSQIHEYFCTFFTMILCKKKMFEFHFLNSLQIQIFST